MSKDVELKVLVESRVIKNFTAKEDRLAGPRSWPTRKTLSLHSLIKNGSAVHVDSKDYSKADIHYDAIEPELNIEDYSVTNGRSKLAKPHVNKTESELEFLSSDIGIIERSCRLDSVYVLIGPNHSERLQCELQCVYYKLMIEMGMTVDQLERQDDLVTVVTPPDAMVFEAAEDTVLGMPLKGTFKVGLMLPRIRCWECR